MKLYAVALLLALFASRAVFAADALEELDGLLSRGKAEEKSCNKFKKKWRSLVKGGLTRESPSHVSREQGLDALKLMEKYPGRASSYAKAWDYSVEHAAELAAHPDQKGILERLSALPPACEAYSHSTHLTLLLRDVGAYRFGKKERAKVIKTLDRYLRDEKLDGSLVALGMKARVLDEAIGTVFEGEGKDTLRQKSTAFLADLERSRAELELQRKALVAAGKAESAEVWRPELELWKRQRENLAKLIEEVSF